MKSINDILSESIDGDTTDFVLAGPNKNDRKVEVHVQLPKQYLAPVRDAINRLIDEMSANNNSKH